MAEDKDLKIKKISEIGEDDLSVPVSVKNKDSKINSDELPEWLSKVQGSDEKGNLEDFDLKKSEKKKIKVSAEKKLSIKAQKPSETDLGLNPASDVEIVSPDYELIEDVDKEAGEKMEKAGIDPKTGKKGPVSLKQEKPNLEKESNVEKKKDFIDKFFGLFMKGNAPSSKKENFQTVKGSPLDIKKMSELEKKEFIEAERIYQEGLAHVKDLIAPAAFEIRYDNLRFDSMFCKSFYVFSYPRYLDTNWLSPIVNFDVTMDISQFIYPIASDQIMKILKKKVSQMQSSMKMDLEKGKVRDPALETALEDAEALRTDIQRGQEKFFQFALYFTIYADDEKKLEKISKQLESLLAGKLVLTKRAQLEAEKALNSTMPYCLDELYTIRNMNTSPLSTTFPFTSSDLTSNKGVLYGLNRHNDSLIVFDRFALENANSVVFAKSGAGKSYAVKLELLRLLMMGTDIIVIDPENEYENLCTTVGGSYLRISLNSDRRINPFDLPSPIDGTEVLPGDLLRSNIINLHGLIRLMVNGLTPAEDGLLDKALVDVYALKGITMDLVDPSIYEPPLMQDLYDVLNSMDGATSLVQKLSKFSSGTFSGLFNKRSNVDLETGLMVFSIRDLEDELRPIAMYIVLNYIWNKVRSKLKKRILVVDEAWSLMQHEDSAKFLFGLVKRARKYYLGVSTITQDVEDFMKSNYGKPIVTNSSMQILLKQAPSAVSVLKDVFNLTKGEEYVLLNSGVGQGLFFAGDKHVAIQVIASFSEDKIVTSNPEEILKRNLES
jgi:conjugal transfer ATP-binding protein TraC